MPRPQRKIAFVLAASDHGPMIVNRFDQHLTAPNTGYGVGFQIMETSAYEMPEVEVALRLLDLRRQYHGAGVIGVDCGANIGVHAVEWARHMASWGAVLAIEAQEPIYYALAGNLALNNCFNVRALHAAVGAVAGRMSIPRPDYLSPGSFGSLELRRTERTEFIGQPIDYEARLAEVPAVTLDSLGLPRVDLLKIDVEGMELEVLDGARTLIAAAHPIMIVERLKTDRQKLTALLEGWEYKYYDFGANVLAVHSSDQCGGHVSIRPDPTAIGAAT